MRQIGINVEDRRACNFVLLKVLVVADRDLDKLSIRVHLEVAFLNLSEVNKFMNPCEFVDPLVLDNSADSAFPRLALLASNQEEL